MSWTTDEIDHLAKTAASNQNVEYKDDYWKEMEALLDAEKPKKRRFGWWLFSGVFLLFTICFLVSVLFFPHRKSIDSKHPVSAVEVQHVSYLNASVALESEIIEPVLQPSFGKGTNSQNTRTTIGMASTFPAQPAVDLSHKPTLVNDTAFTGDQMQLKQFTSMQKYSLMQQMERSSEQTDLNEKSDFESQNATEEVQQVNATEEEQHHFSKQMVEDPMQQKHVGFYLAIGAGAGTPYIQKSGELTIQWNARMGIDYTFSNHFRIGVGIGYRQQMMNELIAQRNRTYYSFGLVDVRQSIFYDRLQQVEMSLHAHYLYRKFAVGIEVTPSYLVGVRAQMKQMKTEYNAQLEQEVMTTTVQKQFVRSDNFNAFGIDLGLTVHYEFAKNMQIEAGVSSRINKLLMTDEFVGKQTKFPLQIKLGLIKRF